MSLKLLKLTIQLKSEGIIKIIIVFINDLAKMTFR